VVTTSKKVGEAEFQKNRISKNQRVFLFKSLADENVFYVKRSTRKSFPKCQFGLAEIHFSDEVVCCFFLGKLYDFILKIIQHYNDAQREEQQCRAEADEYAFENFVHLRKNF